MSTERAPLGDGIYGDPRMSVERTYLGDGVYVQRDPCLYGALVLVTSNGLQDTNTIVLEPEVLQSLLDWIKAAKEGSK